MSSSNQMHIFWYRLVLEKKNSLFGTCESNLFPKWSGNAHMPLRDGNKHPN